MKYPTRGGLIISPYEMFDRPTVEELNTRRRVTRHHAYWQRRNYQQPLHRVFRNLITNTYDLLREQHEELHHDFDAPLQPKDGLMIDVLDEYMALNGVIDCIREKSTHQIYQVTQEQWHHIRGNREIPEAYQRANRVA